MGGAGLRGAPLFVASAVWAASNSPVAEPPEKVLCSPEAWDLPIFPVLSKPIVFSVRHRVRFHPKVETHPRQCPRARTGSEHAFPPEVRASHNFLGINSLALQPLPKPVENFADSPTFAQTGF